MTDKTSFDIIREISPARCSADVRLGLSERATTSAERQKKERGSAGKCLMMDLVAMKVTQQPELLTDVTVGTSPDH